MLQRMILVLGVLFSGCATDYVEPNIVPMKFCIDNCIKHEFYNFVHQGGLQQDQIFDRVEKHCKSFYDGEKCCSGDVGDSWQHVTQIHGRDYGICKGVKNGK